RHLAREERPVGADRVARQRRLASLRNVRLDVVEEQCLGLLQRHAGVQLGEQLGIGVHASDDLLHLLQRTLWRLDHDVDTLAEDVEIEVSDEGGNLDESVDLEVEAGHLTVAPYQSVAHGQSPYDTGNAPDVVVVCAMGGRLPRPSIRWTARTEDRWRHCGAGGR